MLQEEKKYFFATFTDLWLTNGVMDDKELVNKILKGSDAAFRLLMEKYERLVIHMVLRVVDDQMDKEEICQDVFVRVYQKLSTFKFDSKLSTWIATIAYRTALNFVKKKTIDKVDLDDVSFQMGESFDLTEENDTKQFVKSLVSQLPHQYRTVLGMFYLEEFSYPEIVEITGMPEGTVKNYIFRGKSKLKELVLMHAQKEIALL